MVLPENRKGTNAYFAGYVVGGFIGVLVLLTVATGVVTGGFLTKTSEQNDIGEIAEIVESMESKCDAVRKETGATTAIMVETDFEEVREIGLNGEDTSYILEVVLEGGDAESFSLEGCRYELKPQSAEWEGQWSFRILHVDNTRDPVLIRAEGSER